MDFDNFNLNEVVGFEWDEGNVYKNKKKHNLDKWEIEEVFFNEPLLVYVDVKHSIYEDRWFVLGKTDSDLKIMVVFTIRNFRIRVISARKMNTKERTFYENLQRNTRV